MDINIGLYFSILPILLAFLYFVKFFKVLNKANEMKNPNEGRGEGIENINDEELSEDDKYLLR